MGIGAGGGLVREVVVCDSGNGGGGLIPRG